MSDYGVGGPGWDPLPWSWAAERLAANRNFWVVTVSAGGRPHALPVWGVWDDERPGFFFSCSPNARKARNMAANPQVVVMTEDTVECLSVEGAVTPVLPGDDLEAWIELYLAKYRPLAPTMDADFIRGHASFAVTPDRALAVIERDEEFATRATRWTFPT